jgi:hypothetical protein
MTACTESPIACSIVFFNGEVPLSLENGHSERQNIATVCSSLALELT